MINSKHLYRGVIRPVLTLMGEKFHSRAAEMLLFGTAAQESKCGKYLVQLGGGPARGIFQMETWVAMDHAEFMRKYRPEWAAAVKHASGIDPGRLSEAEMSYQLTGNLLFAAAMCRIHYYRKPDPLPGPADVQGLAEYWKKHYNTGQGHGTVEQFVKNMRGLGAELDG